MGGGTKLNETCDLVAHLLSDARAEHVTTENDDGNGMTYPPIPEGTPALSTHKILISHEFPMQSRTINSVRIVASSHLHDPTNSLLRPSKFVVCTLM
jgi:hypothetical protein